MKSRPFVIDIKNKPFFWLVLLPLCIQLVLIGFYYSGSDVLQQLIVPQISSNNYINREFGLLENAQNIILLIAVVFSGYYLFRKGVSYKILNILVFAGFIFLFLEEIDYGWHIREWLFGLPSHTKGGYFRNFHNSNNGIIRELFQVFANLTLALLFIILPALKKRLTFLSGWPIPNQWFSFSAIGLIFVTALAYLLKWWIPDTPDLLNNNTGEFTELWYYHLALMYIVYLRDNFLSKPMTP